MPSLAVFFVGGAACLVALGVARPALPSLTSLRAMPTWPWAGGLIALFYVLAVIFAAPRLGVGLVTVLVLAGQVAAAMTIDHFGLFGAPEQALDLRRAAGALFLGGVVLTRKF